MTAFLVIMPSSARMPRMATKPSGLPDTSSAATTPISPSGPTLSTRNSRWKLRNWTISTLSRHPPPHARHDRRLRFLALLDGAAGDDPVGARQALGQSIDGRRQRAHDRFRQRSRRDIGLHGQGRNPVAPPDHRIVLLVI